MRINKDRKEYYVPCFLSSPAIQMKIHEMSNLEMLLPTDICYKDYILSLKTVKTTVNEKDLEKKKSLLENLDKKVKEIFFSDFLYFFQYIDFL